MAGLALLSIGTLLSASSVRFVGGIVTAAGVAGIVAVQMASELWRMRQLRLLC
jgi:hypothetical protein